MKTILRISILLNLLLLGGLCVMVVVSRLKPAVVQSPVPLAITPSLPAAHPDPQPLPVAQPEPFRWSQLESGNDYRAFIARLRAAGCPESTIEDIVGGNVDRAFAWKRAQLRIDGSGTGPWSRVSEIALVGNLLGRPSSPVAVASASGGNVPAAQNVAADAGQTDSGATGSASSTQVYPLFLANADWGQLGFDANEQAAIAQARQQFLSEVNGPGPNSNDPSLSNNSAATQDPNDPAFLQRWQTALKEANDTLQASLGGQDFETYEMQEYYAWFKPQALANPSGQNLNVNIPAYVPQ